MAPSNALDLSVGEVRQCAVITLVGRLDHTTVDTFKTSIDEALNSGAPLYKGVVIDLTKLSFMSSAGLRMLLAARSGWETLSDQAARSGARGAGRQQSRRSFPRL